MTFLADFCWPQHPGFDFWQYAYQETLRRHGGDPLSGRLLHSRFREVGIPDPQLEVVQQVYLSGEGKLMPYLTIARTASRIVASGVATQAEVERALTQLEALANDTTTAVSSPPTLPVLGAQAVGRPSIPARARHFTGPHPHRVDRAGRILDRRGLCWHRNRRRRRRTTTSKIGRSL